MTAAVAIVIALLLSSPTRAYSDRDAIGRGGSNPVQGDAEGRRESHTVKEDGVQVMGREPEKHPGIDSLGVEKKDNVLNASLALLKDPRVSGRDSVLMDKNENVFRGMHPVIKEEFVNGPPDKVLGGTSLEDISERHSEMSNTSNNDALNGDDLDLEEPLREVKHDRDLDLTEFNTDSDLQDVISQRNTNEPDDTRLSDSDGLDDFHTLLEGSDSVVSAGESTGGVRQNNEGLLDMIADQPVKYPFGTSLQPRSSEELYQHILKLLKITSDDENVKSMEKNNNKKIRLVEIQNQTDDTIQRNKLLALEKNVKLDGVSEKSKNTSNTAQQRSAVFFTRTFDAQQQLLGPSEVVERTLIADSQSDFFDLHGVEEVYDPDRYNFTSYPTDYISISPEDEEGSYIDAKELRDMKKKEQILNQQDKDDSAGYQKDSVNNKIPTAPESHPILGLRQDPEGYGLHQQDEGEGPGTEDRGVSVVTLAFVFDRTGSMWDDLMQVKKGAQLIMQTMRERDDNPVHNYVLVPFDDPVIGPAIVTTDHAELLKSLEEIKPTGGGDCPEMSVGAVKQALEHSRPNSFIYVFTDATAKDYRLVNDVLKLIQKKQSQIVFVMTGDCGDRNGIGFQVYEKIAATSSGQVFNLNKTNVIDVLEFVQASLQSRRVNLLSVNTPSASTEQHEITVDETLQEFSVSVTGLNPTIDVTDPNGNPVNALPQLQPLLTLDNVKVVNVIEPDPGQWKVTVHSDSEHSVRSTGKSDFDFTHGFAVEPTDNMEETFYRPLKGAKNSVLVQATDLDSFFNLTKLLIIDPTTGTTLKEMPLKEIQVTPGLYQGGMFVPSNDFFYLGVEGFGNDGTPIKRITSTAIQSQRPEPPIVHMRPEQTARINKKTVLYCRVESLVPFTVMWLKDGKPVSKKKQYHQTTEVLWQLKRTEEESEGNYTCHANNIEGKGSQTTYLTVTGPPPKVDTPPKVVAQANGIAVMDCRVTSQLSYNISWVQVTTDILHPEKEILIPLGTNFKIDVHPNGTIAIKYANIADEGWYMCIAESKGGKSESRVYLRMRDPIKVEVTPDKFEFQYGNKFALSCVASGSPFPKITWKKDGEVIESDGRRELLQKVDGIDLVVIYGKDLDDGVFHCVAENDAEKVVGSSEAMFVEPPVAIAEEGLRTAKVGGEITLKCSIKGKPKPEVKWRHSGKEIQLNSIQHQILDDGGLRIASVGLEDAGEYTCEAENQYGKESDFIMLDVGRPPTIVHIPDTMKIEIDANASVPCLPSGVPTPCVEWRRKDGVELKSNKFTTSANGNLQITGVAIDDDGTYICKAENEFGTVEKEVSLMLTGIVKPVLDSLTQLPPETTVVKGQRVQLSCRVILGNPQPITTWYRDGEVLEPTQMMQDGVTMVDDSLVISYATNQHAGMYECVVSNVGGSVSRTTALQVTERPSFLDTEQKVYKANEESSLVIPCLVQGHPRPLVTWEKDRMPLLPSQTVYKNEEDNSLTITEATEDDTGTYTCTAINSAGTESKSTILVVQVPPMIFETDEVVNAIEGSVITLYCVVRASPAAMIVWYRDDMLVSSYRDDVDHIDDNQGIRFVANFSDTGMYKCVATNEAGSDSRDIILVVIVSPSIHPPNDEHHRTSVGQNVTLDCHVSGYPLPRVAWQHNGVDLTGNVDVTATEEGLLTLHDVTANASGFYICDAENEAGITQKIFYLQVNVPPKILEDLPLSVRLMEGEDYSIPCTAEGSPRPDVSWRRDGKSIVGRLQEDSIVLTDDTLVLVNATDTLTGVYTCSAENAEGSDQKNYIVQVLVPPSMSDSGDDKSLEVIEGDSIVLTCPAVEAIPAPLIQWLKDGQPLATQMMRSDISRISFKDNGLSLTLIEADSSDSGIYSCIATNLAGHTNATFLLDVLTMPHVVDAGSYQREVTALVGSAMVLECNITGKPLPRVSWKKNNIPVTSHTTPGVVVSADRHSLIVSRVRLHDAGLYQCAATNKVGRRDQDFVVRVVVPPEMEGNPEELVMTVKGKPVLMQCPISGVPDPSIRWTNQGVELKETKNIIMSNNKKILEISSVRVKDDGIYVCEGTNEAGSKSKRFNVTVLEPPTIVDSDFSEDVRVSEGKQAKLACRTRGRPRADVVWLHNGRIVEAENGVRNTGKMAASRNAEEHVLTIVNARATDGGKYACLASNEVGVAEKNYRIKVLVAPKLATADEESNLVESLEGFPITLKCPVEGNPGLDVRWLKDSEPLAAGDEVRANADSRSLHIVNSRRQHAGNYTCVARNSEGNVSKSFHLDVLVPPSQKDSEEATTDYRVKSDDKLELVCNVTGYPPPDIQWFKGVSPISTLPSLHFELEDNNRTLVIPVVYIDHGGQYTCVAINMAGATEKLFNVDIQEPPSLDDDAYLLPTNHSVKLHRRLALNCPMSGSPQPNITWYKDGEVVQSGNNVHISSDGKQLHLMQALTRNAGEYVCVGKNVAGSKKLHFNVDVVVPAEWSSWSEWSECSVICGSGEQARVRFCRMAEWTEKAENCQGDSEEWRPCHMADCQIDGGWSDWSSWTSCSESCGRATRRRYRKCDNPEPKYGGQPCLGSDGKQEYCLQAPCPVNGRWSDWSDWSDCTVTCDQGTKYRNRQCNNPAPAHDGEKCSGLDLDVAPCNMNKCPQHGGWAAWGRWTPCSTTCGPGNKRRYRTCSDPPPRYGGGPCVGENLQIEKCITHSCDKVPLQASLHVKGRLNGEQLDNSLIAASISDFGPKRTVTASVNDLLKQQPGWYPYLTFMLSPVSWNTAYEMDAANNGYSLTNGNFRQQSHIEFATGEELVLSHVGRGLDEEGALHVEIEVQGDMPIVQLEANVIIEPFEEDYVQTGPNSLYASSSSFLKVNGKKMPYSWNNTVSYDTIQGTMPYLVERLTTRDIDSAYDPRSQSLHYAMSTEISRKYASNMCPAGFDHDPHHMHCTDVDECAAEKANRCHATQICENLFGSYRCYCSPGFKAAAIGKRCVDINECLQDSSVCSHQCLNTRGSFRCLCPPGFTLLVDGKTCTDARYWTEKDGRYSDPNVKTFHQYKPVSNPQQRDQEVSHFEDASYRLSKPNLSWMGKCQSGFKFANGVCEDDDECSIVPSICSSEQTCLNTKGAYLCLDTPCPTDYLKNYQTGKCVKFCDQRGAMCTDGALMTQTLSYSIVELSAESVEASQDLVRLKIQEQGRRRVQKTRFRIVENEKGKPFRVRGENGQGVVYALKQLVTDKTYRIIVLALSYDETGKNILYTTRFVIFIHIANDQ